MTAERVSESHLLLEDHNALVTGATAGIGLAIAKRLASEGAHVYLTGRRSEQLASAVEAVGNATGVRADATSSADLDRLYAQIADDKVTLDVLVANVGNGHQARLEDTTETEFDEVLSLNVRSTFFTVQKALPLLSDGAAVILIGSTAADLGLAGIGLYAASKAAVRSFARTWTNELRERRIRVNVISPAAILTERMQSSGTEEETAGLEASLSAQIPLGRVGEPADVADVALFLASSQSRFISGTNTYVDGGQRQI